MQTGDAKSIFQKFIPQIGALSLMELIAGLLGDVAALLAVERVTFSRMEPDQSALQPEVRQLLSGRKCVTTGLPKFYARDYPVFFAALAKPPGLVNAPDVLRDARLQEFGADHFTPLKISSRLDVPVQRAGRLHGVITYEHTGPARRWTDAELDAALSFAHLAALAVETDQLLKAGDKLRQALELEKETAELKTNFVNLVSHEFRTPLGVIISSTDILEAYHDRLKPGQRTGHLQDIRYAAQQMAGLMEEVLLLGKVESGKLSCRWDPLDLVECCERLVEEQLSASGRKCPIMFKHQDVENPAQGDPALLRHIIGNLLSNAVKYSPLGSEVNFQVRRIGDQAVFEIEDQGIGIAPVDHANLFTAFHRGINVGNLPGTGLGLAIVKRCVSLHGGTVSFASQLDQGTRFTVSLKLFLREDARPGKSRGRPTAAKKRGAQKS